MSAIIIGWLVLALVPAWLAARKGRSGVLFYVLGLALSPLLAAVIALVISPDEEGMEESGTAKKCPKCAEMVKGEAKVCRFCGHEFRHEGPMTPARRAELERKMAAGKMKRI